MATVKQTAFAALDTRDPPHICVWTISGSAHLVRDKIGKTWNPDDPQSGWISARTEGIRVVKVDLIALP